MNANTKSASPVIDNLKWLIVVVLVAAGIAGNEYFSDQSLLYRVLGLCVLAVVAGAVAFQTERGVSFWKLIKESRAEIRKVVWPTHQETTQTTLIVVVFVLIVAFILWLLDIGLGKLVSLLIG